MSRHFYLRNYCYKTVRSILNNLSNFFLCIISRLFFSVKPPWVIIIRMSYLSLTTMRPHLYQLRIFFYLNSPTLIVSQMKMKFIQLIESHQIKKLQYLFFGKEITTNIHQSTTIRKTRSILNTDNWNFNTSLIPTIGSIDFCRHQLQ